MSILKNFIDMIYPPRCHVCGAFLWDDPSKSRSDFICRACALALDQITSPLCPICCKPFIADTQEDHMCEDCLRKRPYYEVIYAHYLYEGVIMEAVQHFKYGRRSYFAGSLGPLLARFAEGRIERSDGLLTMPVPLHPKRLRERGFNQSLLLARHVARHLAVELDFLSLRRVRCTSPQTGLGKEERRKNVRGAFRMEKPDAVKERNVLLVDDVATTGNTLNECARVLKRSGCKKVFCLVLARAG